MSGLPGLDGWIKSQEKPFADQNAQADIEGRNRPVRSYGGVDGSISVWGRDKRTDYEKRYIEPTPFERAWYAGATMEEAIAASQGSRK